MVTDSSPAARTHWQWCQKPLEHQAEKETGWHGYRPCHPQAILPSNGWNCYNIGTPTGKAAHLAEAAKGGFKDEVLHLLTKKPINFQGQHSTAALGNNITNYINCKPEEKDDTVEKI